MWLVTTILGGVYGSFMGLAIGLVLEANGVTVPNLAGFFAGFGFAGMGVLIGYGCGKD